MAGRQGGSIDINGCVPMSSRTPPQLDKGKTCQPITAQCRLQLLPPFSETQYLPGWLGAVDSNGESRENKTKTAMQGILESEITQA